MLLVVGWGGMLRAAIDNNFSHLTIAYHYQCSQFSNLNIFSSHCMQRFETIWVINRMNVNNRTNIRTELAPASLQASSGSL